MTEHVRWLTYDEVAREMGIARESARQLAIRKRGLVGRATTTRLASGSLRRNSRPVSRVMTRLMGRPMHRPMTRVVTRPSYRY